MCHNFWVDVVVDPEIQAGLYGSLGSRIFLIGASIDARCRIVLSRWNLAGFRGAIDHSDHRYRGVIPGEYMYLTLLALRGRTKSRCADAPLRTADYVLTKEESSLESRLVFYCHFEWHWNPVWILRDNYTVLSSHRFALAIA
jgi:hypothetical protein